MTSDALVFRPDPLNRNHPLTTGLKGFWVSPSGLDGSKRLFNLAGTRHASIQNGTTWRPGHFASGLKFTSFGDYAAIGSTIPINPVDDFTIVSYCKTSVDKGSGSGTPFPGLWSNHSIRLTINAYDSYLTCFVNDGGGGYYIIHCRGIGAGATIGEWVCVAATVKSGEASLYVNGRLVAIQTIGTSGYYEGIISGGGFVDISNQYLGYTALFTGMGFSDADSPYFKGEIAATMLYHHALDAVQIAELNTIFRTGSRELFNFLPEPDRIPGIVYTETPDGGVVVGGEGEEYVGIGSTGGVEVGGEAEPNCAYTITSSGGIITGGAVRESQGYTQLPLGGVIAGGHVTEVTAYFQPSYGGIEIGGEGSVPFSGGGGITLGGSAEVSFTYVAEFPFSWNLGKKVLKYYQVLGKCQVPPNCDTTGFETDDTRCASGGARTMQTFAATDVTDLCQKISVWQASQGGGKYWPIDKIYVYDKPTYVTDFEPGVDYSCNSARALDFIDIPACLEFLIDYDLETSIGVETFYHDDFHSGETSGGITIGGSAEVTFNQLSSESFSYTADGGITIGGEAETTSGYYFYEATGGITMGGTVEAEQREVDPLETEIGVEIFLLLFESAPTIYISSAVPVLEADTGTVNANCGCDPVSLKLFGSHNLDKASVLGEFMARNGLSLPTNINLIYNVYDKTWRSTYHFRGQGQENNIPEVWTVLFEWGCISYVSEEELDENCWKLSVLISRVRKFPGNFDKTETRLFYTFPQSSACFDGGINFTFKVNSQTKGIVLPTIPSRDYVLSDEIGLFVGKSWSKKPNIEIFISETNLVQETPTKDIKPIFPQT